MSESSDSVTLARPSAEMRALRLVLLAGVAFFVASIGWDAYFAPEFGARLLLIRGIGVACLGALAGVSFVLPTRTLLLASLAHAITAGAVSVAAAILHYGYGYGSAGLLLAALAAALAARDGKSCVLQALAAGGGAVLALLAMRASLDTAFGVAFFALPGFATACVIAHSTGLRLARERQVRSELRALQDDLARFGATDALTGVSDGRQLSALARREFSLARRRSSALSVLKIDVDELATIIDKHGRQTGDEMLRAVASMCQAAMRDSDLLGRVGSESFAALLPEADAEGARAICARVATALQKASVLAGDQVVQVSVRVASATLAAEDKTLDDVLKRAEQAPRAAQ